MEALRELDTTLFGPDQGARGGLMVRNFDSYAYACGFESGLGHGAYGTLGKSPHPVVLCPVSPMSEDACAWC